ncbi:MAG TPA: addiction module protein [Pyrinomonadaceae bacterium]
MTSKVPFPPPGFDELSNDEQIEYIGHLWNCIPSQPGDAPVPDWHMEIVDERLAECEKNGFEGTPLEEFEKELFELLMKG